MNVILVRHAYLPSCTLGHLFANTLVLATLEEPWSPDPDGPGGQRREPGKPESCVPDGDYRLLPHFGTRWKDVWALHNPDVGVWAANVPKGLKYGRAAILIHAGNTVADVEGCVLVGLHHGRMYDQPAVFESQNALAQLRAVLKRAPHQLTIRPTNGTRESQAPGES